jgi:L-Lysine epsilon oxidase N-terminal/L-lysine epsilon oxidase C-terminal domain
MDELVVSAAIHPAIGIARIGDSRTEFFIGPEVVDPPHEAPGYYRDASFAIKRQAARFRIYGLNAAGEVVRELTAADASVRWTVQLANRKAQWYQFQAALDIPDAVAMKVPRRNPSVAVDNRASLAIDPGLRSITGESVSGGPEHSFDTGKFQDTAVPLGEIRTDEAGRLLVLGGTGKSASPTGAPVYNPGNPDSFNNADEWYDDTSDGPVTAEVSIGDRAIPVEGAWVVVAPPNYGPDIVGWRTLYDLLVDVYTDAGWLKTPEPVSFSTHVLPFLKRLTNLQWVNQGFAAFFGSGGPMDFDNDEFVKKLAMVPNPATKMDPYKELRQTIFNAFRPAETTVNESRTWPWIYGDAFGSFAGTSPLNNLPLPSVQEALLRRWVKGEFVNDWKAGAIAPKTLDEVAPAGRPAMLDQAALHFCLADAFHPGCEMTWPMRHITMYAKPFRIVHRPADDPEPDLGDELDAKSVVQPNGPLYGQVPGGITRWMALPWQGDTAFCRSGYEPDYDPYLPTFWAARVPNQVLAEAEYRIVVDTKQSIEHRVAAFNKRSQWLETLHGTAPEQMMQMIAEFGRMGIVEARPGVKGEHLFPKTIFVESVPPQQVKMKLMAEALRAELPVPDRLREAGWESEEQLAEFRSIRIRPR